MGEVVRNTTEQESNGIVLASEYCVTLRITTLHVYTIQSAFFEVFTVREKLKAVLRESYKSKVGFKATNPFQKFLKASFVRR